MIARAEPECCCPMTYDDFPCCSWPTMPDKFTVTIGPVSDCDCLSICNCQNDRAEDTEDGI